MVHIKCMSTKIEQIEIKPISRPIIRFFLRIRMRSKTVITMARGSQTVKYG